MSEKGYFGQRGLTDSNDDVNSTSFIIRQHLNQVRTSVPVKIIAVHGGGVGPAPTVDVQPMINQIDGQGNQTPHGIVYGIPTTRNQGGGFAVINDPKVGDVGHMIISDRDMSALKANNGAQSNPGSLRTHSMADGVYMGKMLDDSTPTQYVQFNDDGVTISDKNGNVFEMKSGGVNLTTTKLTVTGDVVIGPTAISFLDHVHVNVTPGGGTSGPPQP